MRHRAAALAPSPDEDVADAVARLAADTAFAAAAASDAMDDNAAGAALLDVDWIARAGAADIGLFVPARSAGSVRLALARRRRRSKIA